MSKRSVQNKNANVGIRPTRGAKAVPKQQQRKNPPKVLRNGGRTAELGARSTSVASAYSTGVRSNKPLINYGRGGQSCRVRHKEFVQNVSGTVLFTTPIALALNPGLAGTFPWLSNIANNFEQYRVSMMKFCYLTRTGTNVPGSVLMYPDYDAADTAPVAEQVASNYADIAEDAPWKDICCILKPSSMHALGPKKFVRSGLIPNQDVKTTDVGTFFVSTVDGTAVNWGKLWVEYDIEFFTPQLNPSGGFIGTSAQGTNGTAASVISAGLAITGPLISGIVGNVVSFQNMVIGGEYAISVGFTGAQTSGYTAPVGITNKTALESGGATFFGETFIANATSGSLTITLTGAVTNILIVVCPISVGVL